MAAPKKYMHKTTKKIYFELGSVIHKSGEDNILCVLYRPEDEYELYSRSKKDFHDTFDPVT